MWLMVKLGNSAVQLFLIHTPILTRLTYQSLEPAWQTYKIHSPPPHTLTKHRTQEQVDSVMRKINICNIFMWSQFTVQWNLSWGTTSVRDHLSWKIRYSWHKVSYFNSINPVNQRPPVLKRPFFMANGVVFRDGFTVHGCILGPKIWQMCITKCHMRLHKNDIKIPSTPTRKKYTGNDSFKKSRH